VELTSIFNIIPSEIDTIQEVQKQITERIDGKTVLSCGDLYNLCFYSISENVQQGNFSNYGIKSNPLVLPEVQKQITERMDGKIILSCRDLYNLSFYTIFENVQQGNFSNYGIKSNTILLTDAQKDQYFE
jgi:hypothetical protein